MRILALETSSATGSIALLDDDRLIAEIELGRLQRTAQSLAPAIQSALRDADWQPKSIDLICVTSGPGSFTGLRSGVTSAKVLAYATEAKVVAVNTLHVIAANSNVKTNRLWAVMDAQRQQLFAACFQVSDDTEPQVTRDTKIEDNATWLEQLADGDTATGAGLAKLENKLPSYIKVVPQDHWTPTAATLGLLGFAKHQRGETDDFWKLAPQYFRKSAAEEKFDQGLIK